MNFNDCSERSNFHNFSKFCSILFSTLKPYAQGRNCVILEFKSNSLFKAFALLVKEALVKAKTFKYS